MCVYVGSSKGCESMYAVAISAVLSCCLEKILCILLFSAFFSRGRHAFGKI